MMTQLDVALAYLDRCQQEMLRLWETIVRLETPSAAPEAVDKLVKAEDSAFLFEAQPTGGKGDIGAPAGKPSAVSGVEQAVMARNPGLKV